MNLRSLFSTIIILSALSLQACGELCRAIDTDDAGRVLEILSQIDLSQRGVALNYYYQDRAALHHAAAHVGPVSAKIGKMLIEAGANVDVVDCDGRTPRLTAAACGNVDFIITLHQVDPSIINRKVYTSLESIYKYEPFTFMLLEAASRGQNKVIETLHALDADLNVCNELNKTALHLAAEMHQTETVRLLISLGASPTAVDIFGETPLHRAMYVCPDPELVALLLGDGSPSLMMNRGRAKPIDIRPDYTWHNPRRHVQDPQTLELLNNAMHAQELKTQVHSPMNLLVNATIPRSEMPHFRARTGIPLHRAIQTS